MTGPQPHSKVIPHTDGGEVTDRPPVPFTLPRRVRPAPARRDLPGPDSVARDARFFVAVAAILWSLIALEVVFRSINLL